MVIHQKGRRLPAGSMAPDAGIISAHRSNMPMGFNMKFARIIKRESIQFKLITAFFFMVFISLAIISFAILNLSRQFLNSKAEQSLRYVSDYVTNTVDFYISDMNSITYQLYFNRIDEVLKRNSSGDAYGHFSDTERVNRLLFSLVIDKPHITRLIVISRNGVVYSAGRGFVPEINKLRNEMWYTRAVQSVSAYSLGIDYQPNMEGSGEIPVISFTRRIVNISDGEVLGYINMYVNYDVIGRIITGSKLDPDHHFFISDNEGALLYPREGKELYDMLVSKGKKSGYNIVRVDSASTGLSFLSAIPRNAQAEEYRKIKYLLFALVGSFVAVLMAVIYRLSDYFTRPLRNLADVMEKVKEGNLDVTIARCSNDEVGVLSDVFNSMMDRIKGLIEEVKTRERKTLEAELAVLQAQINPHFIYHTLNTVMWIAKINKIKSIQEIVSSLVTLLRTSIGNTNTLITVEKEINYVKSYVHIENFRFKEEIRLECDIPDEMKRLKTLKLVLQPLIENAICHGFEEKQENKLVRIRGYMEGRDMLLEVSDNGKGISSECLEHLLDKNLKKALPSKFTGIGLNNVDERIKLNYGEGYGLKIFSRPGEGTVVTVRQPVIEV